MKLILIFILSTSFSSFAKNRALEIALEVEQKNENFIGETAQLEMILINGSNKVIREMLSETVELSLEHNRSLLTFKLPKDVAGTKLLTWSYDLKDDSQWIYLPAFKKIKKISSSSKTSSFMGSEFTYEDLRAASPKKYNYKFIEEKNTNGDTHWKYERVSKKKSGYSKQVVTISKKYMNSIAIEYFDRSKQLLKKASITGYKSFKVGEKTFWRPGSIHVINVQTKKESILNWKNRKLGMKLKKNSFVKRALK